jgi:hypothetical protein
MTFMAERTTGATLIDGLPVELHASYARLRLIFPSWNAPYAF